MSARIQHRGFASRRAVCSGRGVLQNAIAILQHSIAAGAGFVPEPAVVGKRLYKPSRVPLLDLHARALQFN